MLYCQGCERRPSLNLQLYKVLIRVWYSFRLLEVKCKLCRYNSMLETWSCIYVVVEGDQVRVTLMSNSRKDSLICYSVTVNFVHCCCRATSSRLRLVDWHLPVCQPLTYQTFIIPWARSLTPWAFFCCYISNSSSFKRYKNQMFIIGRVSTINCLFIWLLNFLPTSPQTSVMPPPPAQDYPERHFRRSVNLPGRARVQWNGGVCCFAMCRITKICHTCGNVSTFLTVNSDNSSQSSKRRRRAVAVWETTWYRTVTDRRWGRQPAASRTTVTASSETVCSAIELFYCFNWIFRFSRFSWAACEICAPVNRPQLVNFTGSSSAEVVLSGELSCICT